MSDLLYHLHVLENIDSINWSKISHAYGPATDVPAQLRALAFGDEQERKRALHELHGNIWHQHTIYEATAFAVPFLVELVQNHVPQEGILSLIALIATGMSYMRVHQSLLGKWTAEDEERLQREQQWVKAAKSAVAAHSPFFLALMNTTSNRRIRELCILILGAVESESEVDASDVIERIFGID